MRRKCWIAGACFALVGFVAGSGPARAQEEELVITDSSVVVVADATGRLVPVLGTARPAGAERYWADPANGAIRRGGLDGSRGQELVGGLQIPYGLTYDASAGAFLWVSSGEETVQRFALGDGGPRSLRSEFEEPYSLVVTSKSGETTYAALDGRVVEIVHSHESDTEQYTVLLELEPELSQIHGLALDEEAGVLYVGDSFGRMVQRIDLATREVADLAYVVESFGDSTAEVVR